MVSLVHFLEHDKYENFTLLLSSLLLISLFSKSPGPHLTKLNQHRRELISTQNMWHKYNRPVSYSNPHGMRVNTMYINFTRGTSWSWGCTSGGVMYLTFTCMPGESYRRMYLRWSLCTLYLHACQVSYRSFCVLILHECSGFCFRFLIKVLIAVRSVCAIFHVMNSEWQTGNWIHLYMTQLYPWKLTGTVTGYQKLLYGMEEWWRHKKQ